MSDADSFDRFYRETHQRVLTSTLAVFAVLIVVGAAACTLSDRRGAAPLPPGGSPSVSPSPSASVAPARVITEIPATAMLHVEDYVTLADQPGELSPPHPPTELVQLRLCGTAYSSDSLRTASRNASARIWVREPPHNGPVTTSLEQQVYAYRANGAAQFMSELRDQLHRCPGVIEERKPGRWTELVEAPLAQDSTLWSTDEVLWLKRTRLVRYLEDIPPREQTQYVAVVRSRNVIMIVADHGWETGSAYEIHIGKLALYTHRRVATLL